MPRPLLPCVVEQLEDIDHGTNAHVETLARLDLVKSNMGNCLHTLTEAASWNALVREANARSVRPIAMLLRRGWLVV